MQLTKGAIGNLINRYKAVLKKCHLMNTFGSLAVAGMLIMGGAGVAGAAAADVALEGENNYKSTDNPEVNHLMGGWLVKNAETEAAGAITLEVNGGTISEIIGGSYAKGLTAAENNKLLTVTHGDIDSWRNNRGDKSGITRDEPGHTGKTLCNFIAWDENRRGGKSLPFSSLLDGVRVWPESLFRLSTHHGSGSVGGVLPHLGKPTVGPLAVVFFHR